MRGDAREGVQRHGGVTDLQRFQRASRVLLARLLIVHGTEAPEVLRRLADELDWLAEAERAGESADDRPHPPD